MGRLPLATNNEYAVPDACRQPPRPPASSSAKTMVWGGVVGGREKKCETREWRPGPQDRAQIAKQICEERQQRPMRRRTFLDQKRRRGGQDDQHDRSHG